MAFPIFDSIVVGIILVSAALSSFRGFTREILAITSWIAAGLSAAFLYPYGVPYAQQHVPNPTLALALAILSIFLLTLIGVSFMTSKIADGVAQSRIGALDRTLGLVFGTVRGFLICTLGFLFFTWFLGHDSRQPDWLRSSRTRPLLETSSSALGTVWSLYIAQVLPSLTVAEGLFKTLTPIPQKNIGQLYNSSAPRGKNNAREEFEEEVEFEEQSYNLQPEKSQAYGTGDRRRLERLIGGG
jgi:membrane protein required for colicin V production